MPQTTIYILLVVISIVVGYIGGVLITMLYTEREKRKQDRPADSLPEGIDPEKHTAQLRIWSDGKDALLVEFDNQILKDAKQANADQRTKLEAIVERLTRWLNVRADQPRQMSAVESPVRPASGEQEPIVMPKAVKTVIPAPTLVDALASATVPKLSMNPKSMAEQVDEILQEMISKSSQSHRSVKITQDPHGGIMVLLNGGQYSGLDSVPDVEIKALIRAAAAEWERRSERLK